MSDGPRASDATFERIAGAEADGETLARALALARGLAIWTGPVAPRPLAGGLSTVSLLVEDAGARYVVRIGADVPIWGVVRADEVIAMKAAFAAGVAPEVVHHEPGVVVMRFIAGRALAPEDLRRPATLVRAARTVRRYHDRAARHLAGPGFVAWPYQQARWFLRQLERSAERLDPRWVAELAPMAALIDEVEAAAGPVRVVFSHNDALPQNFIDDGAKLWLVDWEYAGFNGHLFDLAGLAMNAEMNRDEAGRLFEAYEGRPMGDGDYRRLLATMLAASVRETAWSFLAEITPRPIAFDYAIYSRMAVERHARTLARYRAL